MSAVLEQKANKNTSPGETTPLGATLKENGVNFAIFSQYSNEVFLLLFNSNHSEPTDIIKLNRTENTWHIFVEGIKAGQLYGYKVDGEFNPAKGLRFNKFKLLSDPYAKAITDKFINKDNLIFSYQVNSPDKDLTFDDRENSQITPKSIVIDDSFDWQGDSSPGIASNQMIIYETHIKGFTAHTSSDVKNPGTYLGFIEKIPYLKKLGINTVELMPTQEFFIRNELIEKGLTDFWGYNSISFFAPESSFSTKSYPGCQVNEFKTMVKELHKAGIEVILDVVYNHTGEGNELGPTLSFKGIDNRTYYILTPNSENQDQPYRFYANYAGCGNIFNVENPVVMNLMLDSLRYWVEKMHVDGFRFDLASLLARVNGGYSQVSPFFEAIAKDPILNKVKMIAEPWDLTTYQVGNFPQGWYEWNDKFRDTARKFIKGDEGQAGEMARRLTGSSDIYQSKEKKPYHTINFITCHDGFTLHDLFSYNGKHNESNHEENRDGVNDNYSWNCGAEGETNDQNIINLRKQMMKNAFCCLLFSSGTPMILYGDEVMRTQKGNNNAYCQDNELTWLNWKDIKNNEEIFDFCSKAINFRKNYGVLSRSEFFTGQKKEGDDYPDIAWFNRHLQEPNWSSHKVRTLCYQLPNKEFVSKNKHTFLFLVFNMNYRGTTIDLPRHEGFRWARIIDTSRKSGDDFLMHKKEKLLRQQKKHYCSARSVSVFWGEQ